MAETDDFAEVLRDFMKNAPLPVLWGWMTAEEWQRKFGVPNKSADG